MRLYDVADRVGRAGAGLELMIRADAVAAGVQPRREDVTAQWARVLYRLGEEHSVRGDTGSAGADFQLAVDLSAGLESSTDPELVAAGRAARADGLVGLGDLAQARGEIPAALELFTRAVTLLEDLAAADLDNTGYRRDVAFGLARLGLLAQARGDTAAAVELYTRSQSLLEDLATTDPDNTTYRRDLETLGELIRLRANAQ